MGGVGVRVGNGDDVAVGVIGRGGDMAQGVRDGGLPVVGVVAVAGGVVVGIRDGGELPPFYGLALTQMSR
jgi:hypothetical protein